MQGTHTELVCRGLVAGAEGNELNKIKNDNENKIKELEDAKVENGKLKNKLNKFDNLNIDNNSKIDCGKCSSTYLFDWMIFFKNNFILNKKEIFRLFLNFIMFIMNMIMNFIFIIF